MAGFFLRAVLTARARRLLQRRASRLRATLQLLRTAEEFLALVAAPRCAEQQAVTMVEQEMKMGMGVGTCDDYEVITMAQLNALLDELRLLPAKAYYIAEAAELRCRISEDLVPLTVQALVRSTVAVPFY